MTALLVDGDILVYRHAYAEQQVVDWGDDSVTVFADFSPAWEALKNEIRKLREIANADEIRVALSCSTAEGFRREIDPTYKMNRAGVQRPLLYPRLRAALLDEEELFETYLLPRLEGDDVLGLLATGKTFGDDCVIATIDKDLRTVPGRHLRFGDETGEIVEVTEDQAELFFLTQCLTGDATDGYKGVPGIGPVRASRLMVEAPVGIKDLFECTIVPAYAKAGLGREAALTTARLARVLRRGDYNHKTFKVRLWAPTKEERSWI